MADYKWLIFLSPNMSTDQYLKRVNTPFNSEIMTAKLKNDLVDLEEGYRVADNYPLRILKYGSLNSNKKFVAMSEKYLYARRKDMEGFPIRATTRDVSASLQVLLFFTLIARLNFFTGFPNISISKNEI